uniref:uncharacterized protein n=1 Tax=Pristiophorus japonicus TaxID=55135 RepID=UPI00398EEE67
MIGFESGFVKSETGVLNQNKANYVGMRGEMAKELGLSGCFTPKPLIAPLYSALKFPPAASGVVRSLSNRDRTCQSPGPWLPACAGCQATTRGELSISGPGSRSGRGGSHGNSGIRSRASVHRMEAERQEPLKDHCDSLMDSIDAQLSQLQASVLTSQGRVAACSLTESAPFRNTTQLPRRTGTLTRSQSGSRDTGLGSTSAADALSDTEVLFSMIQEGSGVSGRVDQAEIFSCPTGSKDVTSTSNVSPGFIRNQPNVLLAKPGRQEADGESRKKQYEWRVQQLLGPQQMENQGYQSDTNTVGSVCTEDFASRFHEGMVDPALNFDTEPDSEGSFISRASFRERSRESAGLYLEPNSQQGNLGSEVCGLLQEQTLFRKKESDRECAQHDHMSRRERSGAPSKTSAIIQPAQSQTGAERDGFVGCVSPRGGEGDSAADGPVNPTSQRLDIIQQFREELEQVLLGTRSQAGTLWAEQATSRALTSRTASVESLGDRISKLSLNNMSEQTSQRRNFPSGTRILVANQSRESPVNPNPLKEKDLVTSCLPASNPAVIIHGVLGTTRIKLKEARKRLLQSRVRLSRNLNPELQALSTGDSSDPIPGQQESSATSDELLPSKPGGNQQDDVMVNGTHSPGHVAPTLVPHRAERACPSPTHGAGKANASGKTSIAGQWNGMTDGLGGFESQPPAADSCRNSPAHLSGSEPPPVRSFWEGGSDIARSALDPRRRMQSPNLPQSQLTDSVHETKAKGTRARSNTAGSYREESGSPALSSIRDKPLLHRTGVSMMTFDDVTIDSDLDSGRMEKIQSNFPSILRSRNGGRFQSDAGVNVSRAVKKCCSPGKEMGRYASSEKKIMDDEDFEQLFGEPGSEWRTSSPSKWDPSLRWADHTWNRNRGSEMSNSHRCPPTVRRPKRCQLFDIICPDEAQLEQSIVKLQQDLGVEEEKLIQRKSQLQEADQTMSEDPQQRKQLENSETRLEQRTAEITQLLEKNSSLESRVRELQRSQQAELSEINRVREELKIANDEEFMELKTKFEEERVQTRKDQKLLSQETEKYAKRLQAKHEETLTLREQVWAQEESMKKLSEELKQEAKEMVQNALVREHRKWEIDREEQLRQQCLSLEKENGRALIRADVDLGKERRNSLALQNKIVELQKRIQELEFQSHSLQQEKDRAVSNVRTLLTEEKWKEIQQLREELQLEKKHDVEMLTAKVDQLEEELRSLWAKNNEAALKEREARMQGERAERSFVSEIKMECERIQVLIQNTHVRVLGRSVSLPHGKLGSPTRMTLGQAIQTLRGASEDLHQLVMDLHQELESQRRAAHHFQRDKEREVEQKQELLLLEKEEALAVLKDRLIQDHIEEISKLRRSQLKDSGSGEEQVIRQQLQEKDNELRAVQRNMAKWKDETTCKLARKFEGERNAELEKCLSKNRSEHQRKIEKLENEIPQLPMEHSETSHLRSASTPSMASSSFRQQNFGTLKMLQHLQSRVKQLRAENVVYHGASLEDVSTLHAEAGSLYREMNRETPERLLSCFAGKASGK